MEGLMKECEILIMSIVLGCEKGRGRRSMGLCLSLSSRSTYFLVNENITRGMTCSWAIGSIVSFALRLAET